jgi:2-oxoisovalerate dehydrogenase E1 component alpha subunit
MRTAVERARAGEGPTLIEAKTYRFFPHTSDDDDRAYRTREEVEAAKDQDPIREFERYLTAHGLVDDASLERTRAEVKTDVDRQIDEAWNAADPEPDTLLRHVFFEGTEG